MFKWLFRNDGHVHCFSDKKRDSTLNDGTRIITMACHQCGIEEDHVIPNKGGSLMMKAFKITYRTAGYTTTTTIIAKDETELEEALSNKDRNYKIDSKWSKINYSEEVPLSNVMVSDLSVTELITLLNISLVI